MSKAKKIVVGMSGGVDSSVTAALLKEQGYDVSGVFFRLWRNSGLSDREALKDAKKVAKILGIPFKVMDARKEFREKVVQYFVIEYSKGKTPNPCVFCNKNFKFKFLLGEMRKQKADLIATGHYALIKRGKEGNRRLFQAKDKEKDQSYFLYNLNQKELAKIIFPLGEFQKEEVKKLAKGFKLPVASKKESQDICFLKKGGTEKFLAKNIKSSVGNIINEQGNVLGEHKGLHFYTIGQRKGINLGGNGPYFVVSKDKAKNQIVVSNSKGEKVFLRKKIEIEKVNWIAQGLKFPLKTLVRTRYQQEPVSAIIEKNKRGKTEVRFQESQWGIAPGQSAVFFSARGEILGGGIIK